MRIRPNVILLFLIVLKFLLQYSLISDDYELHRDEFLHLDQANHLDWGYLSVPPVTAWISWIIKLLGNSIFWIKFFPAVFGALTTFVVWKTVEALKGNLFALVLAACCVTFSVLFRLNILYQPNSLDVLCWTTLYYCIIRYLQYNQAKWLCIAAIIFAVGFLNKYNIIFLFLGIVPALALTPERRVFTSKYLYYSLVLAIALILPNLIWQFKNGFPVIKHMEELSRLQLVHVNRWSFVKSQLLFFPGTFLIIVIGLYALSTQKEFKLYRSLFWSFLITLTVFLLLKAKDYYAIGVYPVYFAFGSVYISHLSDNKYGKFLRPAIIVVVVLLFLPVYDIAFPNKTPAYILNHPDKYRKFGMLTWEDGKEHPLPQDFADMLGWKELARKVDSVYNLSPDQSSTLILCDNYGQAGAVNFYSRKGIHAVSFHADYINWFNLDIHYKHLIRVKNAWEREDEWKETTPFFRHAAIADSITNPYAREKGTTIFLFTDAIININERIEKELAE